MFERVCICRHADPAAAWRHTDHAAPPTGQTHVVSVIQDGTGGAIVAGPSVDGGSWVTQLEILGRLAEFFHPASLCFLRWRVEGVEARATLEPVVGRDGEAVLTTS